MPQILNPVINVEKDDEFYGGSTTQTFSVNSDNEATVDASKWNFNGAPLYNQVAVVASDVIKGRLNTSVYRSISDDGYTGQDTFNYIKYNSLSSSLPQWAQTRKYCDYKVLGNDISFASKDSVTIPVYSASKTYPVPFDVAATFTATSSRVWLRYNTTNNYIQWKYDSGTTWNNLIKKSCAFMVLQGAGGGGADGGNNYVPPVVVPPGTAWAWGGGAFALVFINFKALNNSYYPYLLVTIGSGGTTTTGDDPHSNLTGTDANAGDATTLRCYVSMSSSNYQTLVICHGGGGGKGYFEGVGGPTERMAGGSGGSVSVDSFVSSFSSVIKVVAQRSGGAGGSGGATQNTTGPVSTTGHQYGASASSLSGSYSTTVLTTSIDYHRLVGNNEYYMGNGGTNYEEGTEAYVSGGGGGGASVCSGIKLDETHILVCATEMNTQEDIEAYISAV